MKLLLFPINYRDIFMVVHERLHAGVELWVAVENSVRITLKLNNSKRKKMTLGKTEVFGDIPTKVNVRRECTCKLQPSGAAKDEGFLKRCLSLVGTELVWLRSKYWWLTLYSIQPFLDRCKWEMNNALSPQSWTMHYAFDHELHTNGSDAAFFCVRLALIPFTVSATSFTQRNIFIGQEQYDDS